MSEVFGCCRELMEFSASDNISMFGQSRATCITLAHWRRLHRRKLIFFKCRKHGSSSSMSSSDGSRSRLRLFEENGNISTWAMNIERPYMLQFSRHTYVKSKYSNFGSCLTMSAKMFQVGISDAFKSSSSKLPNGARSPAQLIVELGSDAVSSPFVYCAQ